MDALHGPRPTRDVPRLERSTRTVAAKFRADSARHIGDPEYEQLISTLRDGGKEIDHPLVGKMVFEHAVFNPFEAPEQRMILYTPLAEADTAAKLAQLLAA